MGRAFFFIYTLFTLHAPLLYSTTTCIVGTYLYSSLAHVARMREGKAVYRVLVGKPEGKRPLGRPRREDNIKMDLQEVGGGCGDWMELAQDSDRWRAIVSTVMNLRVPKMRGIS